MPFLSGQLIAPATTRAGQLWPPGVIVAVALAVVIKRATFAP
jgi:hypothetical protein